MRSLYSLFFAFCASIIFAAIIISGNVKQPTDSVVALLNDLKQGNISTATKLLGDNSCSCPPRGGWVAYLKYELGHEPNLAFLIHQDFSISNIQTTPASNHIPYIFPWDKPEDQRVNLQLTFVSSPPYFLPLELAFGIPMSQAAFETWCKNNAQMNGNLKGLTLRLRNSLLPGTIPVLKPDKKEELLPPQIRAYAHPKDCGVVQDNQNKALSLNVIAKMLPRLHRVNMSFLVVRRGVLNPWTIKSFHVTGVEAMPRSY